MVNWNLLFLLFSTFASKEFGTFYLTEEEWVDLNLHDYFATNEIDFHISNTNSTGNDILLSQNSSIQLVSYTKHEIYDDFNIYNGLRDEIFPIFSFYDDFTLLVWYKGKEIILYLLSERFDIIEKLWKIDIGGKDCRGEITQIKKIPTIQIGHIIILLKCQENKTIDIWRNEFYLINLFKYMDPGNPVKLNLWDAKYLDEANISSQSSQVYIAIYGRFKSKKQIVLIYEIELKPQLCLKLIQSVDHYDAYFDIQENELNVAQIHFTANRMMLLDYFKGTLLYDTKKDKKFTLNGFLDLSNYGNCYSWSLQLGSFKNNVAVGTDKGIIFLYLGIKNYELIHYINIFDTTGYKLPVKALYLEYNYFISKLSNNLILFFKVVEQYAIYQLISIIDISLLIGNSFNPAGMWNWVKSDFEQVFYLRDDYDGIRVYHLEQKDWCLRIWGTHSFYAEITAKTGHKNKKPTKKSLNVISIPIDSNEIYTIANNQNLNSDIKLSGIFNNFNTDLYIHPNHYFSGPNLTFSIFNTDFSNDLSVEILEFNNVLYSKYFDLCNNLFIRQFYENYCCLSEEGLLVFNPTSMEYKNLKNSSFIIDFSLGGSSLSITTLEHDNETQWVSIYEEVDDGSNSFQPMLKIELEHKCHFFKQVLNSDSSIAIICASYDVISIVNKRYYNFTINFEVKKLLLSTYGIYSIMGLDAASSETYSLSINRLIIYIIDKFEGLASIECSLDKYSFKVNKSLQIESLQNFQKIIGSPEFIYLIYMDGKIRVYDKHFQALKIMSTRTAESIIDSYLIYNLLIVQTGSHIFIFDARLSSHDSLYRAFDINEQCKLIIDVQLGNNVRELPWISIGCKTNESTRIYIYKFMCNNMNPDYICSFYFNLKINLKSNATTEKSEFSGKFTLMAQNSYKQSMIDVYYNFSFTDYNIKINYERIPKEIEIRQNNTKNISLKEAFGGNNIRISAILNNVSDEQQWKDIFPFKIQQIYLDYVIFAYNDTQFYDHTPIEEINKYLLSTSKELLILDAKRNFTIETTIQLKEVLNSEWIECASYSIIGKTNNSILIAMICKYQLFAEVYWNEKRNILEPIMLQSLIIFEYDYLEKLILRKSFINVRDANYLIRIIRTSNFRFDIFLMKTSGWSYINNIFWYKGIWNQEKLGLKLEKEIDYLLLGLDGFFIKSFDAVIFKTNQIILYAIENKYGLIAILIDENNEVSVIESIPHSNLEPFESICICQDKLFALSSKGYLFRYSILSSANLIFDEISLYNYNLADYYGFNTEITCMKENTKYTFTLFCDDVKKEVFLRIWNDMKPSDIKIGAWQEQSASYSVKTIGNNQISLTSNNLFNIWNLIDPYIEIDAFSKKNYSKLKELCKEDHMKLEIYAYNKFKKTEPAIINIKCANIEQRDSNQKIWIIFIFSVLALISIISIIIFVYKKKKTNLKRDQNEEWLVLEEIKRQS